MYNITGRKNAQGVGPYKMSLIFRTFPAFVWLIAAALILPSPAFARTSPSNPFPQVIPYRYGISLDIPRDTLLLNAFSAYENWLNNYVAEEGGPDREYRVHRGPLYDYETISEGIGWGMLIAVLMENGKNPTKKYFDGFWMYYRRNMNGSGLMSWKVSRTGQALEKDSSTDADQNVAMALMFADRQWGSAGKINYLAEARRLIGNIMRHEIEARSYVIKPTSGWGGSATTNPSAYSPAYYKTWLKYDDKWSRVVENSEQMYSLFYHRYNTGLYPDWCTATGDKTQLSYDYTYNACLTPLKIGLDFLWNGEGDRYLKRLSNWIIDKCDNNPEAIADGYTIDGVAIGQYSNAAFIGPLCVAAMVSEEYKPWLNKLYNYLVQMKTGEKGGYFSDTIRLISLIIVSGHMPDLWKTSEGENHWLWVFKRGHGSN